ncbi:MAG TPA: UDP-N-acetylmuramate dehydrogenase [Acidobacteriaceae bacterium]|jgi:UDP-N-acetylmuramate dehydrogenase|nr:UDP-N-acetylmuramate dehydrogenase [Acidobacteriaceae bacterium]
MQLCEQVALAPYTTFGIGGPARWFAEVTSEADLVEALRFAADRRVPLFVLGGGSNILVADQGFPGLVVHVALRGLSQEGNVFRLEAGENWDSFVSLAVAQDYGGIECLAGIPGTVGGTPVQNVGAYGQEVSGTIVAVRVLEIETLRFHELTPAECGFSYRNSIFNSSARGRYIVSRVDYRLLPNAEPLLAYPDVQQYFAQHSGKPSLAETAAAVREIRHRKGMLLVEGETDCRSAGSFFRNPVVPRSQFYDAVGAEAGMRVSLFPVPGAGPQELVKVPAAWLLEHAGFSRGYALGAAGISSRHTLALVNRGGATARDVVALRDRILAEVEAKFGIRLEPEPVWVGPEV